jgi:uncharacterized protein (TIGR02466 family)
MTNYKIIEIFPTPLYLTGLERDFNESELLFFKNEEKNSIQNIGNKSSKNFNVLDEINLKTLKNDLNLMIQNYFKTIINPKYDIIPYITQSWLNFTNENEFHHVHNHQNSIVSGVLYINTDENLDSIKFSKTLFETLYISPKNFNKYNSSTWVVNVINNLVILFPSYLQHSVEQKKGNNKRISLAFNVFARGFFGEKQELNNLFL